MKGQHPRFLPVRRSTTNTGTLAARKPQALLDPRAFFNQSWTSFHQPPFLHFLQKKIIFFYRFPNLDENRSKRGGGEELGVSREQELTRFHFTVLEWLDFLYLINSCYGTKVLNSDDNDSNGRPILASASLLPFSVSPSDGIIIINCTHLT